MLTKDDVQRIESAGDVSFERGKKLGDFIKAKMKISFRIFIVVGGIIILGSLFFVAGMFSSRKQDPLKELNK